MRHNHIQEVLPGDDDDYGWTSVIFLVQVIFPMCVLDISSNKTFILYIFRNQTIEE